MKHALGEQVTVVGSGRQLALGSVRRRRRRWMPELGRDCLEGIGSDNPWER